MTAREGRFGEEGKKGRVTHLRNHRTRLHHRHPSLYGRKTCVLDGDRTTLDRQNVLRLFLAKQRRVESPFAADAFVVFPDLVKGGVSVSIRESGRRVKGKKRKERTIT
jgi:hypothetical protein